MLDTVLFFIHYMLILLFGVVLSLAFSGIRLYEKKNLIMITLVFCICGILQLTVYALSGERIVWMCYPLITHFPIALVLCLYFNKSLITALSAITTAYLCCQPAKWVGLLVASFSGLYWLEMAARIAMLLAFGSVALKFLQPYISKLFNKDLRSICIFGSIPMFYYIFDYVTGIYTNMWSHYSRLTAEFLHFLVCIVFMIFSVVYYKEYEQKTDAERNESLITIAIRQQSNRIDSVKRTEKELQILRHDMRLFLNSLSVCIDNGEPDKAKEMIAAYVSQIERTRLHSFCNCDMINYVLSDVAGKCENRNIPITFDISLSTLEPDEMLFCSILSNVLDNAINAQAFLPPDKQQIKVLLKQSDGRLLLSVRNAIAKTPEFSDGLPVTRRMGHGYGTQSIRYMTEKLGGNCQFSANADLFQVRIII